MPQLVFVRVWIGSLNRKHTISKEGVKAEKALKMAAAGLLRNTGVWVCPLR